MKKKEVVVVGGGLSGLAAALKLTENGCHVKLVSVTPVKRSHSVCAQGGINAALNLKGEEDSPYIHAYETIKGGDFLANQPPVLEMCLAAPGIINIMDRFGCTFNRTKEGHLDARGFGGTLYRRTVFSGASTGQQLLYALDEQVRRQEVEGKVQKFENHEFLRLVLDDTGAARGIVMMNLFNMKVEELKADAVVMATGGLGFIFRQSTNSVFCTGAANGRLFRQGMKYANGEFIQIHPTAIPGRDKARLISESVRGEGGRLWVYGDATKTVTTADGKTVPCGQTGKPWYFLEELYPAYGNLVPRDIGSRECLRMYELGLGVDGKPQVFLDVTHLPDSVQHKLESVLDIYEKFTGDNPRKMPMRVFPAVHYSMGGAWVDWPAADDADRSTRYRQMTNIPGCFVIGEADYQYHGANRLGANALLACIFSGLTAGYEVPKYMNALTSSWSELPGSMYQHAVSIEEERRSQILSRHGGENVHNLHEELADTLVRHATVSRHNEGLKKAMEKISQIRERFSQITLDDTGRFANQTYLFAAQFEAMLDLSMVITKGALLREESRGSHAKEGCAGRDDEHWLKTTVATYDGHEPKISYEAVDTRHWDPTKRQYTQVKHEPPPAPKHLPPSIKLPF